MEFSGIYVSGVKKPKVVYGYNVYAVANCN